MIPRIIHYCWFGKKEKPINVKKCIDTWKRYCPTYEIREWNESNVDFCSNDYCQEAYKVKKWAFVSDFVRLQVLEQYGGIYMDTDVEVVKSYDDLLQYGAFMCFESNKNISIGTFGVVDHSMLVKDFLSAYENRHFYHLDGSIDTTTNLQIITKVLVDKYKLKLNGKRQILKDDIRIFPMESFIAKDYWTGWILSDESTYAIHHFASTWVDVKERERINKERFYIRKILRYLEMPTQKLAAIKTTYEYYGFYKTMKKSIQVILNDLGIK